MNKQSIGVVSLGCDKNRVDTETILYKLSRHGYNITTPDKADVIIVNTCAFIESARKESIDTIFEMARYKLKRCKKLIVTGCLSQIYGKELYEDLVEADTIGSIDYTEIESIVDQTLSTKDRLMFPAKSMEIKACPRIVTTPSHYAYLKIADGCNNFCSYCSIPRIRGGYRSIPMEQLIAQARELCNNGARELILVAQDVTKYGVDLYHKKTLVGLLKELSKIQQLKWIRLLYCYPELIDDELLNEVKHNDKICKYLDIPLQHVDTEVLKRMNRRSTNESLKILFDKIRKNYPEIAIRSTFITGFPGETEEQHQHVIEFLREYKLNNVGFFAYSQEENTPACNMPNQIDDNIKKERLEELYSVQREIVCQINKDMVGKVIECVVEEINTTITARSTQQSPEIDGIVYLNDKELKVGDYLNVRITDTYDYDLFGEII